MSLSEEMQALVDQANASTAAVAAIQIQIANINLALASGGSMPTTPPPAAPPTASGQSSYALDLRDLMDAHYGVGHWTQRTGVGVGSDIGPALTDGLQYLRQKFGRGKILIPPGQWLMTNAPVPADMTGHYIEGAGSMASWVVYNNASGAAFYFSAAGGYDGGGIRGLAIMLESGLGNTNSYGILLQGSAIYQPDQMEFEDIYMSSVGASSFWWDNFHIDGSARAHPQGCRIGTLTNVQLFNSHNVPLYISNAVGWTLVNVGVFTGAGANGNDIFIIGGSTHVYGIGVNFGGALHTETSIDVMINGQRFS